MFVVAVLIAIVVFAVAVPVCEMVGCDMGACAGMMRVFTHPGASFSEACSGTWVASVAQLGVTSSELSSLLLTLVAALGMAMVLFAPQLTAQPIRIVDANAPPPPLDPRGERYIL